MPQAQRNKLDKFILAKAAERADELYNPGTYSLQMDGLSFTRAVIDRDFLKWRYDVMIPVKPAAIGQKLSVVQAGMYRKDVWGQIQLRKGPIEEDPVVTEDTLMVFWTTLFIAFDGEVWHRPDQNVWQSVGWVPKEINV